MKKLIWITLSLIILVLILTGCSKTKFQIKSPVKEEVLISGSEEATPTSMAMSYNTFTGYRSKIIDLDQCETCDISINVISTSGNLDLSILDATGELTYKESSIPTGSFSLSLSLAGGTRYTIKINAVNHVGSFDINFLINE